MPTAETICSSNPAVHGWATVDAEAWPDTITWGANPGAGVGADRFEARFESVERTSDNLFDHPDNQYGPSGGDFGQPRPTRVLQRLWVCTVGADGQTTPACGASGATWGTTGVYEFTTDYSLKSDCETSCDPNDTKLTLKELKVLGQDPTTPPPSYPGLPGVAFRYNADRGTGDWANPDWNRLNGVPLNYQRYQGGGGHNGALGFTYENIGPTVAPPVQPQIFANRRRVIRKTVDNGLGQVDTWQYAYEQPELNSVGWQIGGYNADGTTNDTQQYPNSAALYLARMGSTNPSANDPYLLTRSGQEFRGHAHVIETDPTGARIEHWFYQGDIRAGVDPACTLTAGGNNWTYTALGVTAAPSYDGDGCFVALRTRDFLKGREWKTETKAADGTLLQRVEHNFVVDFRSYSWEPENGVWSAWSRENQRVTSAFEGAGGAVARTINYDYSTAYQDGGGQYGNLTRIAEYDGDLRANSAAPRLRLTEHWYNTRDDGTNYLVNALQQEAIRVGDADPELALAAYFYDGNGTGGTLQFGVGATGDLTLVRKFANASGKASGADSGFRYDPFGNQTQETSYAGYASVGAQAGNKFDAPGGGSAARTTTITYDPFFHAFPVTRQRPTVNGLTLTDQAAYDYCLGVMTGVTDPTGAVTTATYDPFGRMTALVKPYDNAAAPTTFIDYYDWDFPIRYIVSQREIAGNAGAHRPTMTFYDGVGRTIQTKRETLDGAQTVVTDYAYDGLDRLRPLAQPRYHTTATAGSDEFWGYSAANQGDQPVTFATTTYDALGRVRTTTTPDNRTTTTTYYQATVGTAASTVDANGHKTRRETDLFGRLRAVLEYSGTTDDATDRYRFEATTTYAYDPRDLLTQVTDAQGNVSAMGYDGLGRKTVMHDPDMGGLDLRLQPRRHDRDADRRQGAGDELHLRRPLAPDDPRHARRRARGHL